MQEIKKLPKKITLLKVSVFLILWMILSSCSVLEREVIVLPADRELVPHPTKEYWTCISDGYFQDIVKKLEELKEFKKK